MSVALTPPSIGRGKSARRRPLTSTRVWFGPRPRRSTCCAPGVKSELLIDCGLWVAPLFWVMDLITRSEEHTSELQSLMRISYAVFCLKKNNSTQHVTHIHSTSPLVAHLTYTC